MIANYTDQLDGKVILTGDFNLAPNSSSLRPVDQVLKNLCVAASVETTRTFLTTKEGVCDYIFVSGAVKVARFDVLGDIVSGHFALSLDFD
jgi:endonuclease/exonuclease/phosphatase (EEP) superfamily protein YafD